jgi:hypothetical protein
MSLFMFDCFLVFHQLTLCVGLNRMNSLNRYICSWKGVLNKEITTTQFQQGHESVGGRWGEGGGVGILP